VTHVYKRHDCSPENVCDPAFRIQRPTELRHMRIAHRPQLHNAVIKLISCRSGLDEVKQGVKLTQIANSSLREEWHRPQLTAIHLELPGGERKRRP